MKVIRNDLTVKGLSITAPYKKLLVKYCVHLDKIARKSQAVSNVVINKKRQFIGLNLDGISLIKDIKHNFGNLVLRNKKILILGAGGATRGVLIPMILHETPRSITVINRTVTNIYDFTNEFGEKISYVKTCSINKINDKFDIIINTTSNNNFLEILPDKIFGKDAIGYDLNYNNHNSVFEKLCNMHKVRHKNGKGMLIELSKIAFSKWFGKVLHKESQYYLNLLDQL